MNLKITIVAALALPLTAAALASEQPSRFVLTTSETDGVVLRTDFIDTRPDPKNSLRQESDVNRDGFIDIDDLLFVINHWGLCPAWSELSCEGDVDNSFTVDGADLSAVIANWGETVPVE